MSYSVKQRPWPEIFPPLERPWGLYKDGKLVGVYKTEADALAIVAEIEKLATDALTMLAEVKKVAT